MTHEHHTPSRAEVRQAHPDAALIRQVGEGRYLAFDRTEDAYRHATADLSPMEKQS